jgi:hypothetical protein
MAKYCLKGGINRELTVKYIAHVYGNITMKPLYT